MKKIVYLVLLVLCTALVFTGCDLLNPLPEEYVEGVKVPREYPDDDLEIYDDAIVFEVEEDDEEIFIKFGTKDEIDDVIDFYEDMFEDNDLAIEETEDDKDEFYAKGRGDGFEFEVTAELPRGEYEERAFMTVVEVQVEFVTVGAETMKNLQGFWLLSGIDGQLSDAYRMEGSAIEFKGMQMDFYAEFSEDTFGIDYTFVDDNTINYTEDGTEYTVAISFETINGIDVITMTNVNLDTDVNFQKSSYNEMLFYQDMGGEEGGQILLSDDLTDADLEYWITDLNWIFIGYVYPDGNFEQAESYNRTLLNSNYTGEDETQDGIESITWYVSNGDLIITFPDREVYWPIDFEYDGTDFYLYFYDLEEGYEGGYWLYHAE